MKTYEELRKINVNDQIERKNGFSYLSWAWAVDVMFQQDPDAYWEYLDPRQWGDTWMVFCKVTMCGRARTAQLPVMDYKNKAIANPDAFAVNTAMQRCLAKAISLHGIGLYIYAGEDVPPDGLEALADQIIQADVKPTSGALESLPPESRVALQKLAKEIEGDFFTLTAEAAYRRYTSGKEGMDDTEQVALRGLLDSKVKTGIRKYAESLKETANA